MSSNNINKQKISSDVVLDKKGRITTLRFDECQVPEQNLDANIFTLRKKVGRYIMKRLEAPAYLFSGAENKMNLLDDWNGDFRIAAKRIIKVGATTLDYDRLYTLWQAIRNVASSEKPILEVGVLRGGSTALMAVAGKHFGKEGLIYACDTFQGHAQVDPALDGRHQLGTFGERTSLAHVQNYLQGYLNVRVIAGDIAEVGEQIAESQLSLIHLDVDVYAATNIVLDRFSERVVIGGMIIVDDYAVKTCPGTKKAVDEFAAKTDKFIFQHLLTGQGLFVRVR